MAKITLGGIEYSVPELNFIALEKAWPFMEQALLTMDPMEGTSAGISVIAAGLMESPEGYDPTRFGMKAEEIANLSYDQQFDRTVRFLKVQLKANEIHKVRECLDAISEEAGLEDASGEPLTPVKVAEAIASLSTETAEPTLPNLLQPDAKGEAGTA